MLSACTAQNQKTLDKTKDTSSQVVVSGIIPAADQLDVYIPLLKGKKVGLMGNQTSVVGAEKEHVVDVFLYLASDSSRSINGKRFEAQNFIYEQEG